MEYDSQSGCKLLYNTERKSLKLPEYGRNVQKMVETISKGAAGCWTLDNLAPRVLRKDYEPGFMVDHFIKDMGIALEEAEKMELPLPSLALTRQLYLAIKAQGLGKKGTQVLVKAIGLLAGKEVL